MTLTWRIHKRYGTNMNGKTGRVCAVVPHQRCLYYLVLLEDKTAQSKVAHVNGKRPQDMSTLLQHGQGIECAMCPTSSVCLQGNTCE